MTDMMLLETVLSCCLLRVGLLLLLVLIFFCVVLSTKRPTADREALRGVPGPRHWFGIGTLMTHFRFLLSGVPEAASYYADLYGDCVRIWIAGVPTLLTTRPSAANHVMRTNGANYTLRFGDRQGLAHIGMLENGIIWNTDVARWRHLRSYFQRAINADALNRSVSLASAAADRMLTSVLPGLQARHADGRIELLNFLRRITLDVVNKLTLGVCIDDEAKFVEEIVAYFKSWEYFLLKPTWTYRLFGGFNKHISSIEDLNRSIEQLIEKKRRQLIQTKRRTDRPEDLDDDDDDSELDFTSWLIDAQERGVISRRDLRQCVLEMMLAGTDTSSVTMYYALVAVAENTDIDEQIQLELQSVLGDRPLTNRDLPKLVYLEAVLKEALRYKPVGPVVLRRAIDDDVIDEFPVPAGTKIIVNLARMHRRPNAFDRPNCFDPKRFLDKKQEMPAQEFMPFGTGPKGCVGQFLAMVEMKSILAELLRRYRVSTVKNGSTLETMATRWDIAQQPTVPTDMYLIKRR